MKQTQLSKDQKELVDKNFTKVKSLSLLTQLAFGDKKLDGRNWQGKLVSKYLTRKGLKYDITKHIKVKDVILTDENKEFILNNARNMTSVQLAQYLFPNKNITGFSQESRAVQKFVKNADPELIKYKDELAEVEYRPPTRIEHAAKKVKDFTHEELDLENLEEYQIEGLHKLISNLKNFRFLETINSYRLLREREMFESNFIDFTWDKPDLTSQEVQQYISLCIQYVNLIQIQESKDALHILMRNQIDSEKADVSMRLSEAIDKVIKNEDMCNKRIESLNKALEGTRHERIKDKTEANKSLAVLVDKFRKEESRQELAQLAELQKQSVKEEIDKLASVPAYLASIYGIGKEEILA